MDDSPSNCSVYILDYVTDTEATKRNAFFISSQEITNRVNNFFFFFAFEKWKKKKGSYNLSCKLNLADT